MTERKPIYLESFALEDYRSIRRAEVSFLPGLNIIIGKNGSGKTSFLNGINKTLNSNFKGDLRYSKKEFSISGNQRLSWIIHNKVNNNGRDSIEIKFFSDQILEPEIIDQIGNENIDDLIIAFLNGVFEANIIEHGISNNLSALTIPYNNTIQLKEKGRISSTEIYRLLGSETQIQSRASSEIIKNINHLDTFNLNDFHNLFFISLSNITHELKSILKQFSEIEDVRISESFHTSIFDLDSSISIANLELDYFQFGKWHKFSELSDGNKRITLIAISIGLKVNDINHLILLEEPELGIHPHQLHKLMNFLKEESETKQIILTTHSPQVLNVLEPDELGRIIICEYDKEKGTQLRHMTEDEKSYAQSYMKEQFLSDFWLYSGFNDDEE